MADISAEQHRINRINELLDRLDKIPGELMPYTKNCMPEI